MKMIALNVTWRLDLHPRGHSLRIVITPSVSIDLSIFRIKSFCTSVDCSRTSIVVGSVWMPMWQIFCASNARRVASKIFAFSNAFLFTFIGAAVITVRHGGRSFSIISFVLSFNDFLPVFVAPLHRTRTKKKQKLSKAVAAQTNSTKVTHTLPSAERARV